MFAFSAAGDVVEPKYFGTSAAIVNGIMFIVGGVMISRPGVRMGIGLEEGIAASSMEMAQIAGRPLLIGVCAAFTIAALMRETHPAAPARLAGTSGV